MTTTIEYPVADLIKNRRSVRSFSQERVTDEQMRSLFEATRWAPSSSNEQPWFYTYVTRDQTELWEKYLDCLNDGNKIWAKDAAALIFSVARKQFRKMKVQNAHAMYDLGGANSFLAIQAVEMGLQVRQMAGFHHAKTRVNLGVPEDFELGVFIAVGYPGDSKSLPEYLQAREAAPRERHTQEEFVQKGVFNGEG